MGRDKTDEANLSCVNDLTPKSLSLNSLRIRGTPNPLSSAIGNIRTQRDLHVGVSPFVVSWAAGFWVALAVGVFGGD